MSDMQTTERPYLETIRYLGHEEIKDKDAVPAGMKVYQVRYEYRGLPGVLFCPVSPDLAGDPDVDLGSLFLGMVNDFILSSKEPNINFDLVDALESLLFAHLHGAGFHSWLVCKAKAIEAVADAKAAGINSALVAALEGLLNQKPKEKNALKPASDALAQACGIPLNPDDATSDQKWWYQTYGYVPKDGETNE